MLCYVNIYHNNFLFGGLLKVIVLYMHISKFVRVVFLVHNFVTQFIVSILTYIFDEFSTFFLAVFFTALTKW